MVGSGHRVHTKGEGVCKHPAKSWLAKAQFWGVPFEKTVEEVKGDDGVKWLRQRGGCAFTNARQRRRGLGQNLKPSCHSSVLGVTHETAVGDDAEGQWDGVVVVVVWLFVWKYTALGGGLGQKPKTGPLGPVLECAIGNSNGG